MSRYEPVEISDLILTVRKPSRYLGNEVNAIRKDLRAAEVTWALAFPDLYELGMSNLGFRVLYHVLNRREETAAERTFMPDVDLAEKMKARNIPLFSWESRAPIRDFDLVGFSLQYELCYTTVLAMLDLAGIPLFAKDRDESHPLVVGGGPCAYSPEPMAPFFDFFVVGEAEEVVHEINDLVRAAKRDGATREELLWELSELSGVYVPSLFEPVFEPGGPMREFRFRKPGYTKVTRRVVPDLNAAPFSERPVVPFAEAVHDRIPIEIQRGCVRGCRFCQVGMLTRPTRQRDPHEVLRLAMRSYETTGYEEVSFLSLSAGDYQCLNGLLEDFLDTFGPEKIAVGLPSLRTETMNRRLAEQIKKIRKVGFTVAPEAATERLRRVINKGNEEKDLLHAVETIFGAGWELVKLYFMIGLPTERDEDVLAIGELALKVLERGRAYTRRARVNVGVSTFVPKPHTPFQWEPHIRLEETRRKQALLREAFGRASGAIRFRYPEAESSRIEAFLTVGDRRVATAILEAYRLGQKLDNWSDHFRYDIWLEAARRMEAEHGVDIDFFAHRERGKDEVLPWDVIDCEVSKPYLWKERERSRIEAATVDCTMVPCHVCGACDYQVVNNRVYDARDYVHVDGRPYDPEPVQLRLPSSAETAPASEAAETLVETVRELEQKVERTAPEPRTRVRMRIRFAKEGQAVALSHLETATAIARALRRAKLPISFTGGERPRPRVSLGPALPVGIESVAETMEIELVEPMEPEQVVARLAPEMPAGLRLIEGWRVPEGAPSLEQEVRKSTYVARLPAGIPVDLEEAAARLFERALSVVRERPSKFKSRPNPPRTLTFDPRTAVEDLSVRDGEIRFTLVHSEKGTLRPTELLEALVGPLPEGVRIRKEAVQTAHSSVACR